MDCTNLLVTAVVAMISVIVIINGEQVINRFDLIKSCGQGIGLFLDQTSDVTSTIHCSILCGDEEECCSFVYDPVSMVCARHDDSVTDTSSLPGDCGIIIGQKDVASCQKNPPCDVIGNCTQTWCSCPHGCSFDSRNWKCVEYCTEYGTTFQQHPGYLIQGFNNVLDKTGKTAEECKIDCASASTFVCRSFDLGDLSNECNTSNETALSQPGSYRASVRYEHFARDCAP